MTSLKKDSVIKRKEIKIVHMVHLTGKMKMFSSIVQAVLTVRSGALTVCLVVFAFWC